MDVSPYILVRTAIKTNNHDFLRRILSEGLYLQDCVEMLRLFRSIFDCDLYWEICIITSSHIYTPNIYIDRSPQCKGETEIR